MFEQRLKKLRKEAGLTQKKLGEKLQLNGSTISFYETGRRIPDYKTLITIANFFNVSTDYLVGRINTRNYETLEILENIPQEIKDEATNNPEIFDFFCKEMADVLINNLSLKDLVDVIRVINKAIKRI